MTKIIGLTGGIGSGKTTLANYFGSFGIPLFIADEEAKKIMQTKGVLSEIKTVFGDIVFEKAILNRKKLAEIVFANPEKLNQLNAIVHPVVATTFQKWVLTHQAVPFVLYESAILFESGFYKKCDVVITVIAPLETRIERVIQRDKITRAQVLNRIHSQWNDEQRIAKSNFVIENSEATTVKEEINKILKILNIC